MNLIKMLGISAYCTPHGEQYMSSSQKEHFMQILKSWAEHLTQSAGITSDYLQQDETHLADITDSASQVEEHDQRIRFNERDRKLAKRIHATMRELEAGDYGYCKVCECEIGIKRLEARPVANMCIDCKTLAEEAEGVQ